MTKLHLKTYFSLSSTRLKYSYKEKLTKSFADLLYWREIRAILKETNVMCNCTNIPVSGLGGCHDGTFTQYDWHIVSPGSHGYTSFGSVTLLALVDITRI